MDPLRLPRRLPGSFEYMSRRHFAATCMFLLIAVFFQLKLFRHLLAGEVLIPIRRGGFLSIQDQPVASALILLLWLPAVLGASAFCFFFLRAVLRRLAGKPGGLSFHPRYRRTRR